MGLNIMNSEGLTENYFEDLVVIYKNGDTTKVSINFDLDLDDLLENLIWLRSEDDEETVALPALSFNDIYGFPHVILLSHVRHFYLRPYEGE